MEYFNSNCFFATAITCLASSHNVKAIHFNSTANRGLAVGTMVVTLLRSDHKTQAEVSISNHGKIIGINIIGDDVTAFSAEIGLRIIELRDALNKTREGRGMPEA